MKEAKFRAWDKKWNRWILPEDICVYGDGTADFIRRGENGDKIEIAELKSGEIVLQQYAGINDSKRTEAYPEGQEVYEGDAVSVINGNSAQTRETKHIINLDNFNGLSSVQSQLNHIAGDGQPHEGIERAEVIGNIHDNPELRKGIKNAI